MAYLTEMERERRRREAERRGVAFDADRDTSYTPSEDELRWLDREEVREDDERAGLPGPEEREILDDDGVYEDEPLPDDSERYLPGARKGGSLPKGAEPPVVEDDTGAGFDADAYFSGLDRPERDIPPPPPNPFDMDLSEDDVAALDAANRATEELPPPGDAYAVPLGDDEITLDDWEDAGGDPLMDPMWNWTHTPNDPETPAEPTEEDFARAAAEAPPDDPEAMAAFDAEMNPAEPTEEDFARAAAEAPPDDPEAMAAFDAEMNPAEPEPDADALARADAFHGDRDMREMEDFGNEYSTGSEVLPMEVSPEARAVMAHAEPDADEMGGPSDMDADDLLDPFAGEPMEERSAELPASTTKSTPYDRPLEEPDFTGADWSDAIRRVGRGIFGALAAAGGHPVTTPFRSEREALEARIRERTAAKGAATSAFAEREAEGAETAATAEERRRHNMAMEEVAGRRATTGEARAATYGSEAASRTAARDAERAHTEASFDPESPESERARERLPALAMGLPADLREPVSEYLAGRRWTADEVETFEMRSPAWWRSRLGRGAGGGAGGGGGMRRDRAIEALVGAGYDRAVVEAMDTRRLQDALDEVSGRDAALTERTEGLTAATAAGSSGGSAYLVPGVPMTSVTTRLSPGERANVHESFVTYRDASSALDHIESVARSAGRSAYVDPEVWGDITAELDVLTSMVADIRGIGVIQVSEMPAVRASIPDPSNITGVELGRFVGSLRSWRRANDRRAASVISLHTNDNPDAVRDAMAWVHGGSASVGGGGSSGDPVTIINPESGEPMEITAEQWAAIQADELRDLVEMVR